MIQTSLVPNTLRHISFSAVTLSNGLTNGGIAAVVIACVLVLTIAAVVVVFLKRRGVIKPPPIHTNGTDSLGFDNAMYSRGDESITLDKGSEA